MDGFLEGFSPEFRTLAERVLEHESFVEREMRRVETAMDELKRMMQRRIDGLDDRMDDVFKKVKDRHGAHSSSDDTS